MAVYERLKHVLGKVAVLLVLCALAAPIYRFGGEFRALLEVEPWEGESPVWGKISDMVKRGYDRTDPTHKMRSAVQYHATTTGTGPACSVGTPCTLHTAMCGTQCSSFAPQPDDIIWVHGGTYTAPDASVNYLVARGMSGTAGHPITFRNWNNEHWIVDCNHDYVGTGGVLCTGDLGTDTTGAGATEYITFWGVDVINSNTTDVRGWETGTVSVTHNDTLVTKVTANSGFWFLCNNPASTVPTPANPCNIPWGGSTININVGTWPNLGTSMTIDHVVDTGTGPPYNQLVLTQPWTGSTGTVRALFPSNECSGCEAKNLGDVYLSNTGTTYINSYFRNGVAFVLFNDNYGEAKTFRGNYIVYGGETGAKRSYGHSYYTGNPFNSSACVGCVGGETGRTNIIGNVSLRSFQIDDQIYHGGGEVSYVSEIDNVHGPGGFPNQFNNITGWPAVSSGQQQYYGVTTASVTTGCPSYPVPGPGTSNKTLVGVKIINNTYFNDEATPFTVGAGKGACDFTFQGNYLDTPTFGNGQLQLIKIVGNGTGAGKNQCPVGQICGLYDPIVIGGAGNLANTFMYPEGNGSGGPAPSFLKANYPNNDWRSAFPTTNRIKYWASPDEAGFGYVVISNFQGLANVTVDPAQMGCVAGMPLNFYNWQNVQPWDDTKAVATQTGCAPISVPTTATQGIERPSHLMVDGATPFVIPPDLGPRFVAIIMRPKFSALTGPTPTNTPSTTPSNTATFTRTPTYTPSLTPTFTPSSTNTPVNSPTPTNTPSASVTPSFTSTNTPTRTPTFTPSRTPTPTPTPSGGGTGASFPASQCALTAPMVIGTDSPQFPGTYISSATDNQGVASCQFTITTPATYRIWLKVYANDSVSDSFYLDIDGDTSTNNCMGRTDRNDALCPHIFDAGEQLQPCNDQNGQSCFRSVSWPSGGGLSYWWNPLNDRTTQICGLCQASTAVERTVFLSAASHTISFRQREKNARIYYITITSDTSLVPSDPPPTPTPAPAGQCKTIVCCNHRCKPVVYPCNQNKPKAVPCPWP